MKNGVKLDTEIINGKELDFYSPPHNEPDLPWVNVYQFARLFMANDAALNIVNMALAYRDGKAAVTFVRDEVPVTIICFEMAEGLCQLIDDDIVHGLSFTTYSDALAPVFSRHYTSNQAELLKLMQNSGGPFMRD